MPYIMWNDSFSLNDPTIDSQHQRLFDLINALHEAVMDGSRTEALAAALAELKRYTEYHFKAEEELLAHAGYPGLEAHQHLHREFIDRIDTFIARQSKKKMGLFQDVTSYLRDWLIDHILKSDTEYVASLGIRR
ncbi:MAG TPA: bacteriohemerythrin [Spirochaetota bacterium]|nr:bacteriohemerythrin [Spirochaetota bacterium]